MWGLWYSIMSNELLLFRLGKKKQNFDHAHREQWPHYSNLPRLITFILCVLLPFQRPAAPVVPLQSTLPTEKILEIFFRDLFENTTAGYVLYGEKPVDLQGFRALEQTMPGTRERYRSIVGLWAVEYLQNCPHKTSNYTLAIYPIPTGYEVLSVNRKAFLKAIQANNLLFTHQFGQDYSPQSLLNELLTQGFSAIFKECPALQGIILGYGTENAITYERCSSFLRSLDPKTTPPLNLPVTAKNAEEKLLQIKDKTRLRQMQEITYYSPSSHNDKVKIPFSYLKNSKYSQKLIAGYQKAQSLTEKALLKPRFLFNVCNHFGITLSSTANNRTFATSAPFSDDEKAALPSLVARTLQSTFRRQLSKEFIAGMRAAEEQDFIDIADVKFLDILWQRDPSLTQLSDTFLETVAKKSNIECIIPGYLYTSIIKASSSDEQLTLNHNAITANYLIQDLNQSPLGGSYQLQTPPTLLLQELIPGLSHGLIGMRRGEMREVYIHPDLAYGPSSEFGQGQALIATVELLEMEPPDPASHFPYLQPVDARHQSPIILSPDQFTSFLHKHAYACGFRSWHYYKKAQPLINLGAVLACLAKEKRHPLSATEKSTLLKLEWLLVEKDPE